MNPFDVNQNVHKEAGTIAAVFLAIGLALGATLMGLYQRKGSAPERIQTVASQPATASIRQTSDDNTLNNLSNEPTKLVLIQNRTSNCEVLVVETDTRGVVRRSHADLKRVGDSHGIGVYPGMKIILKVRVMDVNGNVKYESALHTFHFDLVNRDKKEKYIWLVGDTDPPDAVRKEL